MVIFRCHHGSEGVKGDKRRLTSGIASRSRVLLHVNTTGRVIKKKKVDLKALGQRFVYTKQRKRSEKQCVSKRHSCLVTGLLAWKCQRQVVVNKAFIKEESFLTGVQL